MTRATLPERYGDAQQATAAIDKILAGYKAHGRSDEEGYWWARDAQGEEFRFVISGGNARRRRTTAGAKGAATRKHALLEHELVYFCSEHIENAKASRAPVCCVLAHDINFELHPLAVDGQSCDRSLFRDAIKVVRECSP